MSHVPVLLSQFGSHVNQHLNFYLYLKCAANFNQREDPRREEEGKHEERDRREAEAFRAQQAFHVTNQTASMASSL